jgi:hypothetical protein
VGNGYTAVGNFDLDDQAEIVLVSGSVAYLNDTDMSLLWASLIPGGGAGGAPTTADLDDDGSADVVYSDETSLYVFDDAAEIVAVANDNCGSGPRRGIYVYGDDAGAWVDTRPVWNQHTYHSTNLGIDGSIPTQELPNWPQPGLNDFRLNEFAPFDPPRHRAVLHSWQSGCWVPGWHVGAGTPDCRQTAAGCVSAWRWYPR